MADDGQRLVPHKPGWNLLLQQLRLTGDLYRSTRRYGKRRSRWRNQAEIISTRMKNMHRVATQGDMCGRTFLAAVRLAPMVTFWA